MNSTRGPLKIMSDLEKCSPVTGSCNHLFLRCIHCFLSEVFSFRFLKLVSIFCFLYSLTIFWGTTFLLEVESFQKIKTSWLTHCLFSGFLGVAGGGITRWNIWIFGMITKHQPKLFQMGHCKVKHWTFEMITKHKPK